MLDPSPNNVRDAEKRYSVLKNVHILQGGLGDKVGTMKARDQSFQMETGAEFPLFTLDSLFYEKGRKLAFAHLDVEGLELDVLKGAVKTIRQSKPIFTTEVRVHKDVAYTDALMDFIFDLGYVWFQKKFSPQDCFQVLSFANQYVNEFPALPDQALCLTVVVNRSFLLRCPVLLPIFLN